ncbi:glycoside hydrolase family 3 C-terminal domain-containing protein [Sabulilitoribacter arenilitoris]|uniref:Glycoside hydrolase family 3 C-terminal domain-containing protein n=1 Tax=Wocania arenilitoris TaxID=2044858 RepID=A0AAE3JNM0_9FLAO|nr:glycoside hydrolase family 3 C-terminal domain-containing protein [Wocania arenilitoris]MCF7568821.1 glycoside hydrolase family 3 C-terminal domain-containing protein [Wocania arenilitoris]
MKTKGRNIKFTTTIKINYLLFLVFLGLAWNINAQHVFNDPEVETEQRIEDLIQRLTLEEKVSLMVHESKGIERLGIPPYNWWNECLHGIARAGKATVFPQAIGLAATFDTHLIHQVATVISDEGRAKFNEAKKIGNYGRYFGLTYWSPNVNLFRDPRWGRGQETYGEDPFLSGAIGKAFVEGIQGNDPFYLKGAACAKHYVVHSGPEAVRHEFNAVSSDNDLYNTYLPAFKTLVDAGVVGVMCAYNRTNNELCCGSPTLLNGILRNDWNFNGYIVSDCGAIYDFWKYHKIVKDDVHSAALALKHSVNINCGSTFNKLNEAVEQGLVTEKEIDLALSDALRILFRLGWFDEEDKTSWANLGNKDVATPEHIALARKTAVKSIVMLKNNGILPLKKSTKSIFVTGPNATSLEALMGNYNGFSGQWVTPFEGIVNRANAGVAVNYNEGCKLADDMNFKGTWMAGSNDVTIAFLGMNALLEGEQGDAYLSKYGGDKNDLQLSENQIEFVKILKKSGKPLVAVIMGGSALSLDAIEPYVDAILWAWYPGEQGGNAIADVLFGDEDPGGRLPLTFYHSVNDLPPFEDYSMNGRTYRYFSGDVSYPFGYGLSYTTFNVSDIKLNKNKFKKADTISLSLNIVNSGEMDGDEVIQVYLATPDFYNRPIKSLVAFERVSLKKGDEQYLEISVPANRLYWYNSETGKYEVNKGNYMLEVGNSSRHIYKSLNFLIK